ncbi:MAG: hypothetical protein ACRDA5_06040, partial [Clostridium sp.]
PDPKAKIFHLIDPNDSSSAVEVDIKNFNFPEGRYPCVFVHGMGYDATKESAYSFFRSFEDVVNVFNHPKYKEHDIYLVSYDTKLTDEISSKIRIVLSELLRINPAGDATPLILSVFWRELENRAKLTGDYILGFLEKLANFTKENNTYGFALTHSLGCFTLASAAQKLIEKDNSNIAFKNWLCMAAALPASGFAGTGDFNLAPLIAGPTDGPSYGTSVWYSRMDLVLNIPYTFANGHLAMGVTGPLKNLNILTPMDVTLKVREAHHIEYFNRIETELREVFRV